MSLSAAGLNIEKLHSSKIGIVDKTGDNATDAIDVIGAALQKVAGIKQSALVITLIIKVFIKCHTRYNISIRII